MRRSRGSLPTVLRRRARSHKPQFRHRYNRLTDDQVIINIDKYGNTTAATIPLATRDAVEQGKLKKGDAVIFAAVGAGFTVGVNLWRWAY